MHAKFQHLRDLKRWRENIDAQIKLGLDNEFDVFLQLPGETHFVPEGTVHMVITFAKEEDSLGVLYGNAFYPNEKSVREHINHFGSDKFEFEEAFKDFFGKDLGKIELTKNRRTGRFEKRRRKMDE
jgi:hypothetical protein